MLAQGAFTRERKYAGYRFGATCTKRARVVARARARALEFPVKRSDRIYPMSINRQKLEIVSAVSQTGFES